MLAALGTAAVAPAAAANRPSASELPLTLSPYGLIFVPITVGGADVLAMIDTGAFTRVQISRSLATRLKLATAASDESAQGYAYGRTAVERAKTSVAIGQVVEDAEVTVAGTTLDAVAKQVGTPFEALLGWGFLRERPCRIDYPRRRFAFGAAPVAGTAELAYREVNRAPIVDIVAAGKRIAMLFDTGAPTCTLESKTFGIAPNTFRDVEYTFAGTTATLRTLGRDLSVNAALGIEGVIGTNALERYVVGIDPGAHRIVLS
jgi:predicted aspartyl protease